MEPPDERAQPTTTLYVQTQVFYPWMKHYTEPQSCAMTKASPVSSMPEYLRCSVKHFLAEES